MTLLASERSMFIRNKFRSVLQLRIQNRRQQSESSTDPGLKGAGPPKPLEKDTNEAVRQMDDGATQKSPPTGLAADTTPEASVSGAQQQKRPRLADDLSGEKIPCRPDPLELLNKSTLPLENASISFPVVSDVFEDDISCSCSSTSSSPDQLGLHRSPAFSLSPGLATEQSLSDHSPVPMTLNPSPSQCSLALLTATESINQPMTMTVAEPNSMATTGRSKGMYMTSQNTLLPKTAAQSIPPPHPTLSSALASSRPPRPRKQRDAKPKMRALKYHQYIPPDQRGGGTSAGSASSSSQKSSPPAQPIDPAYSRLLQQQQVFLQLQILNQQQRLTVATSGEGQQVRLTGASAQAKVSSSPLANPAPVDTCSPQKPDMLPANLDDLTVSELRQQLRKRGLPVSGTKPALLVRLRPFQLPRQCLTPAPLNQLGATSLDSTTATSPTTNATPSAINNAPDLPANTGQICTQPQGLVTSGADPNLPTVGLLPSHTPPSGSSPGLQASSPVSSGTPWKSEQAAEELSVELRMRERIRNRPRDRARDISSEACGPSLHPFLQAEAGGSQAKAKANQEGPSEVLFPQVFCSQPCDMICQDFELPRQITASPVQSLNGARSLEEELQEAMRRVEMDPTQSIEDILDEPIGHSAAIAAAAADNEIQSPANALSGPAPPSQPDQLQVTQSPTKDDNFLSSPLCSSLLLELPPSPCSNVPVAPMPPPPPPPPPPTCTTPPPSGRSRKRRQAATFDPADWLESLTSAFPPLTPPAAPFLETDFNLDSDLNVNRVLDLMVEQW